MTNSIEVIRPGATAAHARVALFDFDGTLSLVRSGWMDVMVPMMVEILAGRKQRRERSRTHRASSTTSSPASPASRPSTR